MFPSAYCFILLTQEADFAYPLAFPRAGISIPARMAIMAMTTSNSIKVNALFFILSSFQFYVFLLSAISIFLLFSVPAISPCGISCFIRDNLSHIFQLPHLSVFDSFFHPSPISVFRPSVSRVKFQTASSLYLPPIAV